MKKSEKYNALVLVIFLLTIIVIYTIRLHNSNLELNKSSSLLFARVNHVEATRGVHVVYINFLYHEKPVETQFTATDIDSLKPGIKIRIRVADANPENIRYIGVEQQ